MSIAEKGGSGFAIVLSCKTRPNYPWFPALRGCSNWAFGPGEIMTRQSMLTLYSWH
jgi:hypothetical protein